MGCRLQDQVHVAVLYRLFLLDLTELMIDDQIIEIIMMMMMMVYKFA
jgi:hypothetical protein